ncbi:MAG: permease prefix domain 1-containing protein, partial [Agrococcus casei]
MNDAIHTYINGQFTTLPRTPEVERARQELLQMSEDKYTELVAAGVSANEATGRVITEFGNLDELADDLG